MFFTSMPSGFSLYESGDGGRSGARGRGSDRENVMGCRRRDAERIEDDHENEDEHD